MLNQGLFEVSLPGCLQGLIEELRVLGLFIPLFSGFRVHR